MENSSFLKTYVMPTIAEDPLTSCFALDAACFTPHDLSLFVESLETISRIERERYERRQNRKRQKAALFTVQAQINHTPQRCLAEEYTACSPTPSADEAEDEPIITLEAKHIPSAYYPPPVAKKSSPTDSDDCDENYYSRPSSQESSPRSSVMSHAGGGGGSVDDDGISSYSSHSDSEESGVFPANSGSVEQLDETVVPPRPRSKLITKTAYRVKRSRIIGLVVKRDYAAAAKQEQESARRRERLIDDLLKQSSASLATKSQRRRGMAMVAGSAEERFLDKALRYLSL